MPASSASSLLLWEASAPWHHRILDLQLKRASAKERVLEPRSSPICCVRASSLYRMTHQKGHLSCNYACERIVPQKKGGSHLLILDFWTTQSDTYGTLTGDIFGCRKPQVLSPKHACHASTPQPLWNHKYLPLVVNEEPLPLKLLGWCLRCWLLNRTDRSTKTLISLAVHESSWILSHKRTGKFKQLSVLDLRYFKAFQIHVQTTYSTSTLDTIFIFLRAELNCPGNEPNDCYHSLAVLALPRTLAGLALRREQRGELGLVLVAAPDLSSSSRSPEFLNVLLLFEYN